MRPDLLLSKLYRPAVPPQHVPRPVLTARLNAGLAAGRGLTLISAPPGSGKTTCAAEWLDTMDRPVAWLSLDPADDNPGRFFSYLLAALSRIDQAIGHEIAPVLAAGQLPPSEILSATLINDILAHGDPFLLVLDDFQVVGDEDILAVMHALIRNRPRPLHLVLLTREEPSLSLARLRANNQVTELRAADLRFSEQEAAAFLSKVMALTLAPSDIAALQDKTEGWIVGLQLASLSLRDRPDPAATIAGFGGTHRHLLSYLTEEVLDRQQPHIQRFLLETSILDELTGDLCDAVTGGANGRFLLEQLYSDNLFLIPLDGEQKWYRYHHLFQELLHDQLRADKTNDIPALHRRAGEWYAQAGSPTHAIQHAIAGADYEKTIALIEEHSMDMLLGWHVKTIQSWVEAIPPDWAARSPKTNLSLAWMHLLMNDFANALPYIERLRKMFSGPELDEEEPSIKAEWLTMQATLLSGQGQLEEGLLLSELALATVPAEDATVRSLIYNLLANIYKQLNDYPRACEAYEKLIQHGRVTNDFVTELMGLTGLGLYLIQRGDLHAAHELATQGLERVESLGVYLPISAALYGEMGAILYDWNRIDEALPYFARAAQVSVLSGYSDAEIYYAVIRSRQALLNGDLARAVREMAEAEDLMAAYAPAAVSEELLAQQVRIALATDQPAQAETLLRPFGFIFGPMPAFPALPSARFIQFETGLLAVSALHILLYQAQHTDVPNVSESLRLAGLLLDQCDASHLLPIIVQTLLVRAQLHAAGGNPAAAHADVREALALARPSGVIALFLAEGPAVAAILAELLGGSDLEYADRTYAAQILAAFPESMRSTAPPEAAAESLAEPLSRRELDVLRLIDEGCTNQEIAERLVITLHTVKKHSSNLYAKLGVGSRTQALARARELGLL